MRSLLVPVDFSDHSRAALRVGLAMAEAARLEVSALHAYQISAQNHFLNLDAIRQLEQTAGGEAGQRLGAFLSEVAGAQHRIHPITRLGFATEEVIAVSEQAQFDLVIMGTRGATDLQTRFLGTNTVTVMQNISSPVLAVTRDTEYHGIRRILYPTALENTNLFALARLIDIAGAFGAEVVVLHFPGRDHVTKAERRMPDLLRLALRYDRLDLRIAQTDSVLNELYTSAADSKADLIAVNTTERAVFSKVLSASTSREHADRLKLPLLALN